MVKLKKGVTVCVGGKRYTGEVPEAICPEHLKPKKQPRK